MAARWRSWGRWLIVTALAIIGVSATLVKAFGWGWPWLIATLVAAGAVSILPGKTLTSRIESAARRVDERHEILRTGTLGAARRRVRQYVDDPTEWGVHRCLLPEALRRKPELPLFVPLYVRRDRHEEIVARLNSHAFVLILGDSGAGKTRAAFEAVVSTIPNHRFIAPERTALRAAVEEMAGISDAVLWLDDLENYLTADGLTATMVSRLLSGENHHRVIVATLRIQELKRFDDGDDRLIGEDRRRVLARADLVRLDKEFTDTELKRARDLSHDPRIADAISHADRYGLAEYLAAGPQLLQRWLNGWSPRTNPRGAALVQAAVDIRRAGYLNPLPKSLLVEVHEHYLDARGPRLHPEPLDEAWAWATEQWRDTTALLEESDTDTVVVFDYLVDHVQRAGSKSYRLPDSVICSAVRHADMADAYLIGLQAFLRHRYSVAHEALSRAVARQTSALGAEHADTLKSRSHLAFALLEQGRLAEAAAEHGAVARISERVLGAEHADTLTSRNYLAIALHAQGRLAEAAAEHEAVVRISERVLGAEHVDTLKSRTNLATVLQDQGKLDEAVAEHEAVLRISKQMLGNAHVQTMASRNNLALTLRAQGRLAESAAELEAVLPVMERVFGVEHPKTLGARTSRAAVLQDQGKLDEAAAEQEAVLRICERVLGTEHLDTLTCRHNLAQTLWEKGELAAAAAENRLVLQAYERVLGPEHPKTLTSQNNLALVLRAQGKLDQAEAEIRQALLMRHQVLGAEHPDTLSSRNNLATILREQGELDLASSELRIVMSALDRMLGADHPETLRVRNNLVVVLRDQGKLAEAATELRTLSIFERVLSADHPLALTIRNTRATVLLSQNKVDEAAGELRTVLRISERVLGIEHPDIVISRCNLSVALWAQGRVADAIIELQAALKHSERVLGVEHPMTRAIHSQLTSLLRG